MSPLFGLDGLPFLATSYADSKKLYTAQKGALDKYPQLTKHCRT